VKLVEVFEPMWRRFRRNRMELFGRAFPVDGRTRILDVGGDLRNWSLVPDHPPVLVANVDVPADRRSDPNVRWILADGRRLPFRDGAFDVVFSNAVIEHVGDLADQGRFAQEIRRVGRSYFVETPNRGFFLEPHLMAPFVHWLPRGMRDRLLSKRRRWYVDEIRLLSGREMRRLFPDGRMVRERFMGMTKSIILMKSDRRREAGAGASPEGADRGNVETVKGAIG
jgi:hypothetical protein